MTDFRGPPSGAQSTPLFKGNNRGNVVAAVTLDYSRFPTQEVTLTANTTVTITGLPLGRATWVQLHVNQDATGGRTLVIAGALTPSGGGLALSPAANAVDIVSIFWSGAKLYAQVAGLAFA